VRCSKCGAEIPEGKRFCGDCGSALVNRLCSGCPPYCRFFSENSLLLNLPRRPRSLYQTSTDFSSMLPGPESLWA
jgi:zinc ribbon protein